MQILFSVMMAVMLMVMVPRAPHRPSGSRRCCRPSPTDPRSRRPGTRPTAHGLVEFRDVEFRYPGAEDPVLCGMILTLQPGQTTAIVGSTGAGKTTLMNLIPRLYDVTGGSVLVDGVDVRDLRPGGSVVPDLGIVPQRAFLFSGTVASNVRFGAPDATDEQVWEALDVRAGAPSCSDMADTIEAPKSTRAEPTCPAASGSDSRSPAPWSAAPDLHLRRLVFCVGLRDRCPAARRVGRPAPLMPA
jgi:ATP-binding cassette subfamily B multidrug efflux pump